jgi:hypothetical protein
VFKKYSDRLACFNVSANIAVVILPIVWYECDTWSLTLRRVLENRILRRIFGAKREEILGRWRKLYRSNEEFHNLCS